MIYDDNLTMGELGKALTPSSLEVLLHLEPKLKFYVNIAYKITFEEFEERVSREQVLHYEFLERVHLAKTVLLLAPDENV